jgi:hypothetical protein
MRQLRLSSYNTPVAITLSTATAQQTIKSSHRRLLNTETYPFVLYKHIGYWLGVRSLPRSVIGCRTNDDQQGGLFREPLLKQRFDELSEAALDVLLGEGVWHGDREHIFL